MELEYGEHELVIRASADKETLICKLLARHLGCDLFTHQELNSALQLVSTYSITAK